MNEKKEAADNVQTPEQPEPKPLSETRKAALLRYMTILFSAAFVLVLISLILQMHSSEAKISELNAASTSALSNAEALQAENRALQDDKIALEAEKTDLQAQLDELQTRVDELEAAQADASTVENDVIAALRTELDHTKEAYEALLTAKSCTMREGNVTFSKAVGTVEKYKDRLSEAALAVYQGLLDE